MPSVYSYRCPDCLCISERIHNMSDFVDPADMGPRRTDCDECGAQANLVILYAPQMSVDWTERGGFNTGAGRYFSNKGEREEWMRSTEKVEVNPRTGQERVSRVREVMPEETWAETAYLKECKQAAADGVAAPVHPGAAKKRAIEKELLQKSLEAKRPAVYRELAQQGIHD